MKNKKIIEEEMDIVFLLDRSGSMQGTENDTIGGYNSYIASQKENNARVTTVLFDNGYELLTNRTPIKEVKKLTTKEYYVRGCTALLDAIGESINLMDKASAKKVIFIITTDGLENASKRYSKEQIKELIEGHNKWEFMYIGADIDSYGEGSSIGIKRENISNYRKDTNGIRAMYECVSTASNMYSKGRKIDESWKKDLENYLEENETN